MSEYPGPPIAVPPQDFHPELVEVVDPPRRLPEQDAAALDADERRARRFTLLVGAIAVAALLIVTLAR
ncbi:hypothetical protein [Hamadaea tsunoensis]|uniref:hypothetical protein n=1 Tax=Hamadaea tsunoensis TaxID=53368 RepID=UPI0004191D23|nr:hypothetical protein [Hamadaea tsunoensis]